MSALENLVRTSWAQALGYALAHLVWEGALAALLLLLALQILRQSSARTRYAAACLALFALSWAFAITFWIYLAGAYPRASAFPRPAWVWGPLPFPADGGTISAPQPWTAVLPWLTPVWMAGAALWYLRALAGWIAAQRMRRVALRFAESAWQQRLRDIQQCLRISRPVLLFESGLTEVPVVIGFFRPVILTPLGLLTGFPAEHVEAFLIHELAHIRRCDYLVNLAQSFVEGLLFYHPAVWWISAHVRAERENCCDDAVVALTGDAHGYAVALTTLEESRWMSAETALAATGGNLVKRVHRLLGRRQPRMAAGPVVGLLLISACLALAARSAKPLASPQSVPNLQVLSSAPAPVHREVIPLLAQAQSTPTAQPETPYQKWLNEDVAYITTNAERQAFRRLETDAEREHFIEQFWLRRDPTPGTPRNELKEEHYRRIAYANARFRTATELPGWKTDRGRIYITFGPPGEIDSHPNGGPFHGDNALYGFETWHYRYIEGIGNDVLIEFADEARDGTYHMTMDPSGNSTRFENPGGRFGGPTQPFRRQPVSPAIMVGRDGVPVLLDADSGLAIDAHNPAHSNGRMQILATGLGEVRPDWPTGLAAPMENPPAVVADVKVYLDGAPLPVIRATLAPSYIGFYLIEVQLPPITNLGTSELYLSAGGHESNRVPMVLEP